MELGLLGKVKTGVAMSNYRTFHAQGGVSLPCMYYVGWCGCVQQLLGLGAGMAASPVDKPLKAGYHRIELFKAEWEVPIYYQDIAAIGTGAYGTVW